MRLLTLSLISAGLVLASAASPVSSARASSNEVCWDAYRSKKIRSFTGAVRCINKIDEAALRPQTPHQDLIAWLMSRRLAIAEQVDNKTISPTEGVAQLNAASAGFTTAHQQRVSMIQAAQPQSRMVICNTNSFSTLCF